MTPVPAPAPALAKAKPVEIPAATVDTFGDLRKLRDEFAPTERLYQKCYEQLKTLVSTADPAAEFEIKGERYTLRISAREFESKPNVGKARKLLGAALFLKACMVTKTSLENYLLKPEIAAICDTTQTGSRTYDPVPVTNN